MSLPFFQKLSSYKRNILERHCRIREQMEIGELSIIPAERNCSIIILIIHNRRSVSWTVCTGYWSLQAKIFHIVVNKFHACRVNRTSVSPLLGLDVSERGGAGKLTAERRIRSPGKTEVPICLRPFQCRCVKSKVFYPTQCKELG